MPKSDDKLTMHIVHPATLALAHTLNNVKKAIAALNKKDGPKDTAEAAFDDAMEPFIAEFDPKENRYCFASSPSEPRMLISRTYNAGAPRIDRDRLLERGVDPAIIDDATSRTPSEYWRLEELPAEEPKKAAKGKGK